MELDSSPNPPPVSVLFARGVLARLATWPILRIAIQESWGGPEGQAKRRWIAGVLVDTFEESLTGNASTEPDDVYIEEMLLQILADEYEVRVEDGSAEDVARDLIRLWDECKLGKDGLVKRFEEGEAKVRNKRENVEVSTTEEDGEWTDDDEDGEDADDEEMEEAPQLLDSLQQKQKNEPEVDEDGFTLVKRR
ncbi:hypothetical protein BDN72DRAFT_888676 [Pluteus cervinus]|uniref:Uncharacterized protein n=1 Tax=Pluteus cervinus TaxID=181527 RepID=A0ACD3AQW4_9AGAR|nr:hypothetical protein BDN72DRAFT_888676 [Pluteus cervinus]